MSRRNNIGILYRNALLTFTLYYLDTCNPLYLWLTPNSFKTAGYYSPIHNHFICWHKAVFSPYEDNLKMVNHQPTCLSSSLDALKSSWNTNHRKSVNSQRSKVPKRNPRQTDQPLLLHLDRLQNLELWCDKEPLEISGLFCAYSKQR